MRIGWRGVVLAIGVFAMSGVSTAAPATFRVATDRTNVGFAVSSFGIGTHEGRFDLTWGRITLDSEHHSGSIDFVVDVGSVNTGWDLRDAFLKSDLMFDAEHYPSIRFRSTHLDFEGSRLVAVDGEMTLHGVTRRVRFEVAGMDCAADGGRGSDACGASVSGRISRSAFGMSFAYPLVGDEVALRFLIRAVRAPDPPAMEPPERVAR